MIEESLESIKTKKSNKNKKKVETKMIEQQTVKQQKIQQEGKEMSELSESNPLEEKRQLTRDFYQLLQDLISFLLLDHEQFKQQIEIGLQKLSQFDLSSITHKIIMAYSFIAKITFIDKKIKTSTVTFDFEVVQKIKQRLKQIFKQGLRQSDHLKKYYKIN